MDEDVFNTSIRKFLKTLGVTAQREIELAVREHLASGDLQGDETLGATATSSPSPAGTPSRASRWPCSPAPAASSSPA